LLEQHRRSCSLVIGERLSDFESNSIFLAKSATCRRQIDFSERCLQLFPQQGALPMSNQDGIHGGWPIAGRNVWASFTVLRGTDFGRHTPGKNNARSLDVLSLNRDKSITIEKRN